MSRIYVDRISPYQSGSVQVDGLSLDTGSLATKAELNAYTQSNDGKVNSLIAATSSYQPVGNYATTGSNSFTGKQTITTGGAEITGSLLLNGNITQQGYTEQNFVAPGTNQEKALLNVSDASVNGKSYGRTFFGIADYPSFGNQYEDYFAIEYYDGLSYNFGSEFDINGKQTQLYTKASGSGQESFIRTIDNYDGTSQVTISSGNKIALNGTTVLDGTVNLSGSINIGPDSGDGINFYQGGSGQLRFWSGSNQGEVGTWVNLQPNPSNGALSVAAFPHNYHFVHFEPAASQSRFEGIVKFDEGIIGDIKHNIDAANNAVFLQNPNYFSQYHGTALQWRPEFSGGVARLWLAEQAKAEVLVNSFPDNFAYDHALKIGADSEGGFISDWDLPSYGDAKWLKIPQGGTPAFQRDVDITGSLSITEVAKLAPQDPLPAGQLGMLAVSGSDLYFHNGTSWIVK